MGWPPKAENYTIWIEVLDWLKLHYIIYSVSQQYLNDGVKNTYTRITFYYSYSRVVYNVKTLIYDGK